MTSLPTTDADPECDSSPLNSARLDEYLGLIEDRTAADREVFSRLDAVISRLLVGRCETVAREMCADYDLKCPVLVRDGEILSEPTDDIDLGRIRLSVVGSRIVTAVVFDYDPLFPAN